jgi:hypothetical protein
MTTRRLHLPSLLLGALGALLGTFALGLAPTAPQSADAGRFEAEISQDGSAIVLVDTTNGATWLRRDSGAAISSAKFQPLGKPQ